MLDAPITQALSHYLDLQTARMKLTATNMANQNTAGYARRVVSWTGSDSVTLSGTASVQVPTATVTAQRSSVLDTAVVSANADASAAGITKSALDDLQSVFAISGSGDEGSGINTAMSSFFAAMQTIAADPTSTSARQAAFSAAEGVAASFQQASSALSQQTAGLNGTIANAVGSVNALTASIASLNGSISRATNTADRDGLLDQRTAQIQSLSQLVGVQQTANSDGSVSLYTTGGGTLVTGDIGHTLTTGTVGGELRINSGGQDITGDLQGGTIGGALSARDGAVASTQASLDGLAAALATAVNTANANGKTASGSAGGAIFAFPAGAPHAAASLVVLAQSGTDFAAAGSGEGANGTGNANALAALGTQKNASGDTFADTLSAVISSIGTAAASAGTRATVANAALAQASSNQANLSGISLDTEAANLTQFQRGYEAQAKLIAVLNQIMADTINMGSNTAVS